MRRVEVLSKAGKATGKYRHAYNVRDLRANTVGWVDLKNMKWKT